MKFNSNDDNKTNRNLRREQHEFAKTDFNGRLNHSHTGQNNNTINKSDTSSRPVYIPYVQRNNYSPNLFYGNVTQPWTTQNTAGWLASDMTNPYNPNAKNGQYIAPHKKHPWRNICLVLVIILAFIIGWGAWTNHNANQQSTRPQAPRVIKKTVINHQPAQNQNNNSNDNNLQNLQQHAQQLQAEMQNLKLTSSEQQELLKLYQQQSANTQNEMYAWASRLGNMQFVPNNVKRSAVVWALHHYSN